MVKKPIHVCWIARITGDLKLPDQPTNEIPPLMGIPNLVERQPKQKCFDTFQSLRVKSTHKVSSL